MNLANYSAVIYPEWSSSKHKNAFLTELKLFESLVFNSLSILLMLVATDWDLIEPENKVLAVTEVIPSEMLPLLGGESGALLSLRGKEPSSSESEEAVST